MWQLHLFGSASKVECGACDDVTTKINMRSCVTRDVVSLVSVFMNNYDLLVNLNMLTTSGHV